MTKRPLHALLPALVVVPLIAADFGGWAVITVEDLPDYAVAGRPVDLAFTVRQHGVTLLGGLRASVEATAGSLVARAAATAGREAGRYSATLTLPQSGEWAITIHSGFHTSSITLLPLAVVEPAAAAPAPVAEAERGRRLFVAKGCVTCHVHGDVATSTAVPVGPELSGRRYPPDYLRQFLANPAIALAARSGPVRMPNLNLRPQEIAALAAFINTERQALQ